MFDFWPFNIRLKRTEASNREWLERDAKLTYELFRQGFRPYIGSCLEAHQYQHILACYKGEKPYFTNANQWPKLMNVSELWWRPVVDETLKRNVT